MSKRHVQDMEEATRSPDQAKKSKLQPDTGQLVNTACETGNVSSKASCMSAGKHEYSSKKIHAEASGKTSSLIVSATASCSPENQPGAPSPSIPAPRPNSADECDYFNSYSHLDIHRAMIDDSARTQTYRRAILTNYPLFYGKTVLDVGCGTGILSVFCCLAGARRVYAVEASDAARFARLVAEENGFAERIRVLQRRVEEVELPERVDVIVSEWMGHALLYESMLESVLLARDRWLRPGGAMFPERAVLKMALCTADALALEAGAAEFWRGVHGRYGVHMASLAAEEERARRRGLPARVALVFPDEVHSQPATLTDLDLRTVPAEKVRHLRASDVELTSFGRSQLTGLALWFDVHFPGGETLRTSPYEAETHWGQTVLPLEPLVVNQDTVVRCQIVMRQDEKHPRNWRFGVELAVDSYDMSLEWVMDGTS